MDSNFNFCSFCYKLLDSESNGNVSVTSFTRFTSDNSVQRFLRLVKRFLSIPGNNLRNYFNGQDNQVKTASCETCSTLVGSFNELYHEMKCVELKMQMKIGTLLDVMRAAEHLDLRGKLLKSPCKQAQFVKLDEERKEWLQKCAEQLLKCTPTLQLRRISTSSGKLGNNQLPTLLRRNCILWLISLSIIGSVLLEGFNMKALRALMVSCFGDVGIDDSCEPSVDTPNRNVGNLLQETSDTPSDDGMDFEESNFDTNSPGQSDDPIEVLQPSPKTQQGILNENHQVLNEPQLQNNVISIPQDSDCEIIDHPIGNDIRSSDTVITCGQNSGIVEKKSVRAKKRKRSESMINLQCTVEGCQYQTRKKQRFRCHQILHKPGSYSCTFCDVVASSAIDLSLHEWKEHSDKSPGNGHFVFQCRRCSYGSNIRLSYTTHFASDHLGVPDLDTFSPEFCCICKLEVIHPREHWRCMHNDKNMHSTSVVTCTAEKCHGNFVNTSGYDAHRRDHHKVADLVGSWSPVDLATVAECKDCEEAFPTESLLQAHVCLFTLERLLQPFRSTGKFKCEKCSFETSTLTSLLEHQVTCFDLEVIDELRGKRCFYKCPGCSYTATKVRNLIRHRSKVHLGLPIMRLECNECVTDPFDTGTSCDAKFHGEWKCRFCRFEVKLAKDLVAHEVEEHKSKSGSPCPRCKWSANKTNVPLDSTVLHYLTNHLGVISSKTHKCDVCGKQFTSIKYYKKHMEVHENKPAIKFNCDQCPEVFRTERTLILHKRKTHNPTPVGKEVGRLGPGGEFPCEDANCEWTFDSKDDSLYHKLFRCRLLCPVICQVCGIPLKGKGQLFQHMKTHDPIKEDKHKCSICKKSFKDNWALEVHMEFHKGPEEWKFMCAVCSKKCPTKQKLSEHMRTHSKEKPFVCEVCGEKYAHRHNWRLHMETKHKEIKLPVRKFTKKPSVSRKGKQLGFNFCLLKEEPAKGQLKDESRDSTSN